MEDSSWRSLRLAGFIVAMGDPRRRRAEEVALRERMSSERCEAATEAEEEQVRARVEELEEKGAEDKEELEQASRKVRLERAAAERTEGRRLGGTVTDGLAVEWVALGSEPEESERRLPSAIAMATVDRSEEATASRRSAAERCW